MGNFKQLNIWRKGIEIAKKTLILIADFPKRQEYGLANQMSRAAISIPSNIAEGSSRSSTRDHRRFIEIALGSSFELETQLTIAETASIGNASLRQDLLNDITEEQKMLMKFHPEAKIC